MSSSVDVSAVVIGAGIVGLSVAHHLAQTGVDVIVFERHSGPGRETSTHNSQVIHAGIYYPPGSWRARLCVEGRDLLYSLLKRLDIPHRKLGKLIVACSDDEVPALKKLQETAKKNGVHDLRLIDQAEVRRMEPAVRAVAALHSPSTGIVDAHELIKGVEALAISAGARVLYATTVLGIKRSDSGEYLIDTERAGERDTIRSRVVINAAGLYADQISATMGLPSPTLNWCRGDYCSVSGTATRLVSRLIYPIPHSALVGLGVHVTLDMSGRMLLGPDTTYIDKSSVHAAVDATKAAQFHAAVQRYLPDLPLGSVQPDSFGIRPKRQGPNDPWQDFYIEDEAARGYPAFINLIGIDSPGLTASLALARVAGSLGAPYF